MTVLIDTNIILDYILKRERAEEALACLDYLFAGKSKVFLTASVITDIYYITKRTLHDSVQAKAIIAKLLNAFQIAAVDKTDCVSALGIDMDDYEDSLVSICAKKVRASYIITQNTSHFTNSPVPAIKPMDFLEKYKQ